MDNVQFYEYNFSSEYNETSYSTGWTPLHLAAQRYDVDEVENLLQAGFSSDVTSVSGETPIHVLLSDEDRGRLNKERVLACLEKLVNHRTINAKDLEKETPLSLAVHNNFEECVRFLIKRGADTTVRTSRYPKVHSLAMEIASKMPSIMMEILDSGVTKLETSSDKLVLRLDWRNVMQYSDNDLTARNKQPRKSLRRPMSFWERDKHISVETMFIYRLLNLPVATRQQILSHPLMAAFLFRKGEALKRYNFLLKGATVFFTLCYMSLTYICYFNLCTLQQVTSNNGTENTKERVCEFRLGVKIFSAIMLFFVFFFGVTDIRLAWLLWSDRKQWRNWRTWVFRTGVILMGVTLWPTSQIHMKTYKITWEFPLAAVGVLYSWLVVLIHLDLVVTSVVVKLEMMAAIIINVFEITLLFTPLFIGFYMGFTLLFYDITNAMQFIMMTVDLSSMDYEQLIDDVLGDDGNVYKTWYVVVSFAFCVVFVIAIGIVFLNFLLGVTLHDIQSQKEIARTTILSNTVHILFVLDLSYPSRNNVALEESPPHKLVWDLELPRDSFQLPAEIRRGLVSILELRQNSESLLNTGLKRRETNNFS